MPAPDFVVGEGFRVVQFTPTGSWCSIHFGKGITSASPGSAGGLYLVVSDIEAARAELVGRGVEVGEIFQRGVGEESLTGRDPMRRTYSSYATFSDPDGNEWLLQEVTTRLPGRVNTAATDDHVCPYGLKARDLRPAQGCAVDGRWLTTREAARRLQGRAGR